VAARPTAFTGTGNSWPRKAASPKAKTSPAAVSTQYPFPLGVGSRWIAGERSCPAGVPWNGASPKAKTPPSAPAIQ
jgi:hypothetical protein